MITNTPKGQGRWSAVNRDGAEHVTINVMGRDEVKGTWAGFKVTMTADDAYILMKKLDRELEDMHQPTLPF